LGGKILPRSNLTVGRRLLVFVVRFDRLAGAPVVTQSDAAYPPHIITIDRRRNQRREGLDDAQATPTTAQPERRKKQRRRQIDPTTCERDYSGDEIEFMHAMDAYKRASGRMFPTCSEVLEVIRALGYVKAALDPADEPV
jgi:hypothetical protein